MIGGDNTGRMAEKILVRGNPGSGKTTLVIKVVENVTRLGYKAAGFVTEEIREGKSRRGFKIRDLGGREAVLAHVELKGGPRVGKYTLDVKAFEDIALEALQGGREDADFLVIDEVGRMEIHSSSFRNLFVELLDMPIVLLATFPAKDDPFNLSVLQRADVSVFRIDVHNRDKVREVVEENLIRVLSGG